MSLLPSNCFSWLRFWHYINLYVCMYVCMHFDITVVSDDALVDMKIQQTAAASVMCDVVS